MSDRALFLSLLRRDFHFFTYWAFSVLRPDAQLKAGWALDALCHSLRQTRTGTVRRLVITMPPRTLKSTTTSVAFCAWCLGRDPALRFICASYSDNLARLHARDFRKLVEHPVYQEAFPEMRIDPRKNTETEVVTTRNGFRFATSVGGTLTGRGGDYIIIDDPINAQDAASAVGRERVIEWYTRTAITRLDNRDTGSIIVVMQRLHDHDLAGHLLEAGGWTHLNLPVRNGPEHRDIPVDGMCFPWMPDEDLMPEHLPRVAQLQIQREIGEMAFAAQYLQQPRPAEGVIIKVAWLSNIVSTPERKEFVTFVHSWDVATKVTDAHDWSVVTVWGVTPDDRYHLVDVRRFRKAYPDLLHYAKMLIEGDRPTHVLIEDAGNGAALLQELSRLSFVVVQGIRPRVDKEARLVAASAAFERGAVCLPPGAPWAEDYIHELTTFPAARHDDQVDSTTQFIGWIEDRRRERPPIIGPVAVYKLDPDINWSGYDLDDWM